jgi:CubicO group peptidase (beta-lactamase class C family)
MRHLAGNVLDLSVTGLAEPLGVTDTHPFWSEDRQQFVVAGRLRVGERLRSAGGESVRIARIAPRPGPPVPTYNLEIDGQHVYHVGYDGLLVHNSCPVRPGPSTDPNAPHNRVIRELEEGLSDGHRLIAGGSLPERLIYTPGGHRTGRRPDLLIEAPDGSSYGINVGRTRADGTPVTRETLAIEDLEGVGIPMHFVPYDR